MDGWRLAFLIWTAYLILIIIGLWMFAAEGLDEVDAKKGEKDARSWLRLRTSPGKTSWGSRRGKHGQK